MIFILKQIIEPILEKRKKMKTKSIMHVSFFTDNMEAILDFYNKLGFKVKMKIPYKMYKGRNRGYFSEMAEKHEEKIAFLYIEVAPNQFVEFFPKMEGQTPHRNKWNENVDYSHFAILVDDIFEAKEEILRAGIELDSDIRKGPTETYQFWIHDPDGNKIEIMQFTENSLQVLGTE